MRRIRTRNRKSKYPLQDKTVFSIHKKHLQPIPEVGKRYHCYDDGKVTFSRHYIVKIDEVLGYIAFKRKYPEEFKRYVEEAKDCYWLYSRRSDKFVVSYNGEDGKLEVFVRTKDGGWFSIGRLFNCGELDVTGKMSAYLVANIDRFDYTEEEKKKLLREFE